MGRWFSKACDLIPIGALWRLQHSQWLTRAMARPRNYPRIPIRPVDKGGFDTLMSTPHGRKLAERWWERALEMVDDVN